MQSQDHLSLLCVCRQLYEEARESFYRRPLICRSQEELVRFVQTRPDELLQKITNIRLYLQEVESEVMQPFLARISVGDSVVTERHPYVVEKRRIINALARLPNITNFSLLSSHSLAQSAPSSSVLSGIIAMATSQYTTLQKLRIDFYSCNLASLATCRELISLQLVGFSETNAVRTAEILSGLGSLDSLSIIGHRRELRMRQAHGHQSKIVQSIDHYVLNRIRPLKRLVIKEAADAKSGNVFLTTKMLASLYDRHNESLRALHISSTLILDPTFTTFLEALLMETPNIRELALTWPSMQVAFVECVPASVQNLTLLVYSPTEAQGFVDRLSAIRYRLPYLRHIRFEVKNALNETCNAAAMASLPPSIQQSPVSNIEKPSTDPFPFPFMLPIQNLCL